MLVYLLFKAILLNITYLTFPPILPFFSQTITLMNQSGFPISRALFIKCVGEKDIGKIFAMVGVLAALFPAIGNPTLR